MDLRSEIKKIVGKIVEAERLGGGFRLYHWHAVDELMALITPTATSSRTTSRPLADHAYVSAGDNPYTSGDRVYRGCSLTIDGEICGRPRSQHRA